jgi:hypothetical protein
MTGYLFARPRACGRTLADMLKRAKLARCEGERSANRL